MYWVIVQPVRGTVQAGEMGRQQPRAVQQRAVQSTGLGQEQPQA